VPGRPSTAARRRITELEIIEQAGRLFAERGFAGSGVQDIADASGVSRPTLYYSSYYYFKSKDDLLASLVTEVTEGAAAQIRALARDDDKNATERLRSIARLLASWRSPWWRGHHEGPELGAELVRVQLGHAGHWEPVRGCYGSLQELCILWEPLERRELEPSARVHRSRLPWS
jgi:AcrR family transcriptional regulator